MVLPEELRKLTGCTASADGGASSVALARRVMTLPDQAALPASTPR